MTLYFHSHPSEDSHPQTNGERNIRQVPTERSSTKHMLGHQKIVMGIKKKEASEKLLWPRRVSGDLKIKC